MNKILPLCAGLGLALFSLNSVANGHEMGMHMEISNAPQIIDIAPGQIKSGANVPDGQIIADNDGMSLYTFEQDAAGQSNCYGGCAQAWPPALADSSVVDSNELPDNFSIISRDGGDEQWAYNDEPLYGWFQDGAPGDTTGDNVNGFFVAIPTAA